MDKNLLGELKKVIKEAGEISLYCRRSGLDVLIKSDGSPVTNADKEISDFIYNNLLRLAPKVPIICEERDQVSIKASDKFWLIDPIDGTKSYINNSDNYTINIALVDNGIASYGLVYQPTKNRLYFTDVVQNFCIEKSGILEKYDNKNKKFTAVISSRDYNTATKDYLQSNNISEIITISSSIKLCMIAEGSSDIHPKFGTTMEWDTAAGNALVKASGGDIITKGGNALSYAKEGFVNPEFIAFSKRWLGSKKIK